MNSARVRRRTLPGVLCVLVGVLLGTLGLSLSEFRPGSPPLWGTLLLALGGVAAVAGVLDVVLTPGDAVPHAVAAALHDARTADVRGRFDGADAVRRVYLPDGVLALAAGDTPLDGRTARDAADATVDPVGTRLVAPLAADGALDAEREVLVARLADAATGRFELADGVTPLDVSEEAVRVAVSGGVLGATADPDHPITSLFGVALARAADAPVEAEVEAGREDRTVVAFRQV